MRVGHHVLVSERPLTLVMSSLIMRIDYFSLMRRRGGNGQPNVRPTQNNACPSSFPDAGRAWSYDISHPADSARRATPRNRFRCFEDHRSERAVGDADWTRRSRQDAFGAECGVDARCIAIWADRFRRFGPHSGLVARCLDYRTVSWSP